MIRWQTFEINQGAAGTEKIIDFLAGMSGKNRVIKFLAAPKTTALFVRLYRDADQLVNFDTDLFTTGWTLLPVDIPLMEGQLCKGGVYTASLSTADYNVAIGYEETG